MNKIESVMKLYKSVFPDRTLEKRGSWIRVTESENFPSSYYSDDLLEEIFTKTGNMYEWDGELKSLHMVAAHADTLWDTGDSWSTQYDEWNTTPEPEPEEDDLFEDIGEV
jgi:hypothetical protein